jgi:hypothetical protein
MSTPLQTRTEILAELWTKHRDDANFSDFFEYADVALPLSYILREEIVEMTDRAARLINETFEVLLAGLDIPDKGFRSLKEML